jgi:hypothetical protein
MVWETYSKLFQHPEVHDKIIRKKDEAWKVQLADEVIAAHQKPAEYYSRTDGPEVSYTTWPASQKLDRYQSDAFEPEYVQIYENQVREYYKSFYAHLDDAEAEELKPEDGYAIDLGFPFGHGG